MCLTSIEDAINSRSRWNSSSLEGFIVCLFFGGGCFFFHLLAEYRGKRVNSISPKKDLNENLRLCCAIVSALFVHMHTACSAAF